MDQGIDAPPLLAGWLKVVEDTAALSPPANGNLRNTTSPSSPHVTAVTMRSVALEPLDSSERDLGTVSNVRVRAIPPAAEWSTVQSKMLMKRPPIHAVASVLPSGENAMQLTLEAWPAVNLLTFFPESRSTNITVVLGLCREGGGEGEGGGRCCRRSYSFLGEGGRNLSVVGRG